MGMGGGGKAHAGGLVWGWGGQEDKRQHMPVPLEIIPSGLERKSPRHKGEGASDHRVWSMNLGSN